MSKAAWSTSLSSPRRGLLLGGAGLALAGCGFSPLYGPQAGNGGLPQDLRRELAAVRMEYMGERIGVLTQRALERRFASAAGGEVVPARYALQVASQYGAEILGYRRDGAISRVRYTATSSWVLSGRNPPQEEIGRGTVRTIDAFNVPDYQYFSAEISRDGMEQRLLNELVEQIFLAVAGKLRERQRAAQG